MSGYEQYLLSYSASKNILPLTSACNVSCVFCSHTGNPSDIKIYKIPPLSLESIQVLAGFMIPQQKIVIGESVTTINEGEPFTHPQILTILTYLRQTFPDTVLAITTNGSLLTKDTVRILADLGGIEINLSLNSATVAGRQLLMNDKQPQMAIGSMELLEMYGIFYHGSIVAMPHIVGWDNIFYTLKLLAEHQAKTIRVFIPGFTRFSPEKCCFEAQNMEFWSKLSKFSAAIDTPITVEPHVPDDLQAVIEGVITASPAAQAGFKKGDIIKKINGSDVFSRAHAFTLLLKSTENSVLISRSGCEKMLRLHRKDRERPGLVMYNDMDYSLAEEIRQNALRGKTAVFVSSLAYPLWEKVWKNTDVAIYEVPNCYFGGDIRCAGLLTVGDYQKVIDQMKESFTKLLLPSISFDGNGRDLRGISYTSLKTKAATQLL